MTRADDTSELIVAARGGDLDAYGALYDRLAPSVHRFVGGLGLGLSAGEVEDVIQETFLRLFDKLPGFDVERALHPYVLGIARLVAFEQRRRAKPSAQLPEVAGSDPSASERLARRESNSLIRDALAALAPEDQAAIALRHTNRLTMRELAESLSCSIPTARNRLREAARRFAAELRVRGVTPAMEAL